MTFTDRNFTSTDFTAQKQQISEEGIFPLTFVGLTFHPERIFEENGEEKRQAGRIEADFINDVGEFATVRYYEFRYTQIFNLIEYMANMGYFQGFPEDFTFEEFEHMSTAEKVQFVNNLNKTKLLKITVLSESRVSTSVFSSPFIEERLYFFNSKCLTSNRRCPYSGRIERTAGHISSLPPSHISDGGSSAGAFQ